VWESLYAGEEFIFQSAVFRSVSWKMIMNF